LRTDKTAPRHRGLGEAPIHATQLRRDEAARDCSLQRKPAVPVETEAGAFRHDETAICVEEQFQVLIIGSFTSVPKGDRSVSAPSRETAHINRYAVRFDENAPPEKIDDLNPRRFRANRLLQALQRLIAKRSFFRSRNGSRRAFRRIIQH
jgi:hypothetical protein